MKRTITQSHRCTAFLHKATCLSRSHHHVPLTHLVGQEDALRVRDGARDGCQRSDVEGQWRGDILGLQIEEKQGSVRTFQQKNMDPFQYTLTFDFGHILVQPMRQIADRLVPPKQDSL